MCKSVSSFSVFLKMSQNNVDSDNEPNKLQTREEYVEKLNQWLDDARLWHNYCTTLPYYANLQNQTNLLNSATRPLLNNTPHTNNQGTFEFVIPPLWKRMVAEVMDFFILIIIKLIITFLVIESFYIVSIENYRLEAFKKNFQDPKIAMQMSVEILTLELLHRFIVCCYETYWLKGGTCATPGKRYMGLMVIKVNTITPLPSIPGQNETVRVNSSAPLGLRKAIIRSVLKNLFLGIMLPMCFTLYIFRYNRTGYDAMSSSLVVEYNPNFQFQAVQ